MSPPHHSLPSAEDIALRRLDNGILLAARENFASPAVVMAGVLQVGSMDEPLTQEGLASLTASLTTRGTQTMDYHQLNEAIEGVGARVSIYGRTHTTATSVKSLAEDFPSILSLVADMLRQPTFPVAQVERVRAQRVTFLRERQSNTRAMAELAFYERAYPAPHPYHRDTSGTPESVAALEAHDLQAFHRDYYGPNEAIFVVVGAIAREEALDRLEAALGGWAQRSDPARKRAAPAVEGLAEPIRVALPFPTKSQSDLIYGLPTIPRNHPDFMALQLSNLILGGFGMMGRIGKKVREEEGLAYYARSSLDATYGPSAWMASAGVAPEHVEQALGLIQAEWRRMGAERVDEAELADSKALMGGSLPLRLETNEGVARALLDMLFYDLGLDYLLRYQERVAALSAARVQEVSQHYFDPERAVLVVAGP